MISSEKMLFVIGAQKAGTTWLRQQLFSIKEFSLSPIKEIHYYSAKHDKNVALWAKEHIIQQLQDQTEPILNWIYGLNLDNMTSDTYFEILSSCGDGVWVDFSPEYCLLNAVAYDEILTDFPNSKFVYLIRHPIDRAISQINMQNININDLSHLLEIEEHTNIISQSRIKYNCEKLVEILGDKLLILDYKLIMNNPLEILEKIFHHVFNLSFSYHEAYFLYLKSNIFSGNYNSKSFQNQKIILNEVLSADVEFYEKFTG